MSIEELKQAADDAQAAVHAAHEALKQAQADRAAAIAAHASGDTSAKLDAADKAITGAGRAVEIAEAALAPAREALAAAKAAAYEAETERLRGELKALRGAADAAADLIDQRVKDASDATATYAEAMRSVAAFHVQHAERLRLPVMGMPQHLKVELHLPPAGDIPRRVGKVPRMAW
jgi:hypothetical protein